MLSVVLFHRVLSLITIKKSGMIFRLTLIVAFVEGGHATGCFVESDKGAGYKGVVSVTKSGRQCQSWSSQTPHKHTITPERHPASGLVKNYCRNPSGGGSAPWCFTTDPSSRWEYCDIPKCEECYDIRDSGASYRGKVARSQYGYPCLNWAALARTYPRSGLVSNYCRNPGGKQQAPWCSVSTSQYDLCSIPTCPVDCYNSVDSGTTYRGSVSQTESGLQCQQWNAQSPHKHTTTPLQYPNSGLTSNFCRNPTGYSRPWCYTTNPSIFSQYCNIRKCEESASRDVPIGPTTAEYVTPAIPTVEDATTTKAAIPQQDCYTLADQGALYRGNVSVTLSGRRCQNWNLQHPHRHAVIAERFPNSGLEKNYCRNPGDLSGPWCLTRDRTKIYELCDIPQCENAIVETTPLSSLSNIRLANGSLEYGRVEVLHRGLWGTICDDDWDVEDGTVVCRMLGYTRATSAPQSASFGPGIGPVWLDDVSCNGNESSISQCTSNGWGTHDCSHSEDASVYCV